jgi:PAS domain S-box-containing protein
MDSRQRLRAVPNLEDAARPLEGEGEREGHKGEGLWNSEVSYRLLAQNSTDVISVTDSAGVLLYVSPSCVTLTGYLPEEMVGRVGREFVHEDDVGRVIEPYRGALRGAHRMRSSSFRVRRKDGSYVWAEAAVRPVLDPATGEVIEFHAATRDITERKQVEIKLAHAHAELARKAAALKVSNIELERFAYDASHDLAEPLRMMAQYAERLRQDHTGGLDDDGRQLLVSLVDGLDRAQTLIADLLEYSQVALSPMECEPVDCNALVHEVLGVLSECIAERQAVIHCDPLPTVRGHRLRLGQCFQNLLSNALKFASPNQRLEIHVGAERQPGGWGFYVQDNGVGIDPSEAGRAFELFGRLQPNGDYAGAGIGLSICRRVVEQHGGRIWVEPAPGGGSIFSFTIADEPAEL